MTKINIGDKVRFRFKILDFNKQDAEGIVACIYSSPGCYTRYVIKYVDECDKDKYLIVPETRIVSVLETVEEAENMVNHPAHYNVQGRKECIEEMIEIYGPSAVYMFCTLNAYKYNYRAGHKDNKEQDEAKAVWYINKAVEMLPEVMGEEATEIMQPVQYIADHYGWKHQLNKFREELQELDEAIGHYLCGDEEREIPHVIEEMADVMLMMHQIMYLGGTEVIQPMWKKYDYKINRQLRRIADEQRNQGEKDIQ